MIQILGSRFFPQLDGVDLYVEPGEIDGFLAVWEALRRHLPGLAKQAGYEADCVAERFGNIVAEALRAKAAGGGIIIGQR
ncbi:hypothetical protein [Streptomyces albireticuli]|uniref:Uncharacterized protein n=1 Tax=Streptomyces albireticuli TaxID=1940 RepID=A0A2A2DG69_9ACTN|nr:hypothetical protein [Streptomyces albireticuli]MCD9146171.1 hypothetical protein [Streptomyces albireticuli]MCD9166211.1 hypothetical protein [Streptomyces albireticuli]MCD9196532.1 hypothetical protein [Streptomyces albireticuli]PAU50399.1 hypothetical protein CK936_02765 [Streptomyces albireticuli]